MTQESHVRFGSKLSDTVFESFAAPILRHQPLRFELFGKRSSLRCLLALRLAAPRHVRFDHQMVRPSPHACVGFFTRNVESTKNIAKQVLCRIYTEALDCLVVVVSDDAPLG